MTHLEQHIADIKYDLREVVGALGAADAQRAPSDDQIIADHIRGALIAASRALRVVEEIRLVTEDAS